jgi:polyhydroxybutyrate depolymerase
LRELADVVWRIAIGLLGLLVGCGSSPGSRGTGVGGDGAGGMGGEGGALTRDAAAPDAATIRPEAGPDLLAPVLDVASVAADSPPPPASTASQACGMGLPTPQEGVHDLMVGGSSRKFFLRVPSAYDGKQAWPVIFAFHGAGNKSASWFDTNTDLKVTTQEKAVLVFPEGPARPDGMLSWVFMSPQNVLFVDAMIDWLKKNACIDPSRLFATGQSSGGYMAMTLGCQRGDVFRAVATSSGGIFDPTGVLQPGPCVGTPGIFLRTGKADTASTHDSVVKTRDFWLMHRGCNSDPPRAVAPVPCGQYAGCSAPVIWCEDGGSHGWPPYASQGMWDFFSRP